MPRYEGISIMSGYEGMKAGVRGISIMPGYERISAGARED